MTPSKTKPTPRPDNPYLEPSSHSCDRGEKIGIDPAFLSKGDLKGLGHPTSPLKAIRANCVACCGDSYAEANKCTATGCQLWPYRMGRNPFHAKAKRKFSNPEKDETRKASTKRVSDSKNQTAKNGGLNDIDS